MLKKIRRNIARRSRGLNLQNIAKVLSGLALAYTVSVIPAYSQDIVIDGKTNTTLSNSGITTNISTSTIKGSNAFNSFAKFNVANGKVVNLNVPDNATNLINLVHDESTSINGVLNSIKAGKVGGDIFLVNPHGITVGSQGILNVGSLTAITPTRDFMNGFFISTGVVNDSSVEALLSGSVPVNPDALINIEGKVNAIGNVKLDTGSITSSGKVQSGAVFKENSIETGDVVNLNNIEEGTYITNVAGDININAESIGLESGSVIAAKGVNSAGGNINLSGSFVAMGGVVDASGTSGGSVNINAGSLSLAEIIKAQGADGTGGSVNFSVSGKTLETSSSFIDVSGATGGSISHIAGQQITTSGNYKAFGNSGDGGTIHISAPALKFLSTKIDASGETCGGEILLGGEYQGGKNLETDIIPNAQTLVMTSGTEVKASTIGTDGNGGTVITWADQEAIVLGDFEAIPGSISGDGGFVEVSSGDSATFGGNVQTGFGDRLGDFLLDPKNIIIADQNYSEYNLIIGYHYGGIKIDDYLESNDNFGQSVSLDGNRLAVGAYFDDGLNNVRNNSGAVYLFSFTDSEFKNGVIEAIIGKGYTGGKNINQNIEINDYFGRSVSLDDNRLAVGAIGDDGYNNSAGNDRGAIYLYSFTDSTFNGGNLEAIIGDNYTGGKNIDQSLGNADWFGVSVSLDGNMLAVGASGDRGNNDSFWEAGAVYLYSFSDNSFNGGNLEAIIGDGYTGGKNIDINLISYDHFGGGICLDNNQLAVGAYGDDGFNDLNGSSGAVYLYTFTDSTFNGGNLEAIVGSGYSGGKNINQTLDNSDQFGYSVSLDNNRLAVGAYGDYGFNNDKDASGAVYLYTFTDSTFSGGNLEAIIGNGYSGGKNINQNVDSYDYFGSGVSLDGNRLVVSAWGNKGFNNNKPNTGAVYLYTFADANFNDGVIQETIGYEYNQYNENIHQDLDESDYFGCAVTLDGNRLVVGAYDDDGNDNSVGRAGAVYLYSFTDSDFNGGVLEGIIGNGYTGGKNIDQNLSSNSAFGYSVSLDNNALAVSSILDFGFNDDKVASGAVYLYTFADSNFNGGSLQGIIGDSYTGGKNINQSLDANDYFGRGVSLNNNRLAVGADQDDGFNNTASDCGAVYLYSFTDSSFSGGNLEAIIGKGYTGGKNINLDLDNGDYFGWSVSLDDNNLAVGSWSDDGFNNTANGRGAVYLYGFSDSSFNGGNLEAIIGDGYTGGKNIDQTLGINDHFGSGVSLDGTRLAIGAEGDDAFDNSINFAGAVYIYSFDDTSFNNGYLNGIIGDGYTGNNNYDISLEENDYFGSSVSLDGDRLAIGAEGNDGIENLKENSGAVYLFTLDDTLTNMISFGTLPGDDVTISSGVLSNLLSHPQNVTFQANNDITISADIFVNNTSGDGGKLTLQAGRSILVNANITTDNGDLDLIANELVANGVVDAQRDAGNAVITMSGSSSIDAGTGAVKFDLLAGVDKNNNDSGDITLNNITAGSILVTNKGETSGSDVVINNGATLNASDAGNSLVLSSANGTFTNNSNASALTSGGRWLVYTDNPTNTSKGGIISGKVFNKTYAVNAPGSISQTGNRFLFSNIATLTFTAENKSKAYGDNNPAFTYIVSGYEDGDTFANAYSGDPSLTTPADENTDVGTYAITTDVGSLYSDYGYKLIYADATLTVNKTDLTVAADNKFKTYGDANPALTENYSGFVLGQDKNVLGGNLDLSTIATQNSDVGTYGIVASGHTSGNYNIRYVDGTMTINKANLTVTADDKAKIYGDANPALTESYSGFVLGQDKSVLGGTLDLSTPATQSSGAGIYGIVASGYTSGNYSISYTDGSLTINKADLNVNVDDKSKTYGDDNPELTAVYNGFVLGQDKSVLGGSITTTATKNTDVGTYAITGSTLTSGNYNIINTDGTLTISKANLTVTADDKSRTYGSANPEFTAKYNGFVLGQDSNDLGGNLSFATPSNKNSVVGTYSIIASGYTSGNYNINYKDGTMTVNKADLTITADDKSKTYGENNPPLTASYSGFVLGQDESALDGSLDLSTPATKWSKPNSYLITPSGVSSNNYNISYQDGTLTVKSPFNSLFGDNDVFEASAQVINPSYGLLTTPATGIGSIFGCSGVSNSFWNSGLLNTSGFSVLNTSQIGAFGSFSSSFGAFGSMSSGFGSMAGQAIHHSANTASFSVLAGQLLSSSGLLD